MINQPGPTPADTDDFEQMALGYGQRRVVLVAAMLGGLTITGAGLGWLFGAAVIGESLVSGLLMTGLGLFMAGLGWLVTAGLRFTRKLPNPQNNGHKAAASTRNSVVGGWIAVGLFLVGIFALFLFAPRGRQPDMWALFPMLMAVPVAMLLGFYRIRNIIRSRDELYARWLAKHHR